MIADRIVIENNEIIFRLDIETVGANAAEIAIAARDIAVQAANDAQEALSKVAQGGYQGIAGPSTNPGAPSTHAYYFAQDSGTYTNFGGLVVDSSEGINILSYSGSAWSKAVVPIDLTGYIKENDLGDAVLDIREPLIRDIVNEGSIWRTDTGVIANLTAPGFPEARRSAELIPVMPGATYFYTGHARLTAGVSGFDLAGNHVSRILDSSTGSIYPGIEDHENTEIIIPSGVFFVGVSSGNQVFAFSEAKTGGLTDLIGEIFSRLDFDLSDFAGKDDLVEVVEEVDDLKNEISNLAEPGENLIDQSLIFYGVYSASGVLGSTANTVATPLIPIDPAEGFLSLNKNMALGVSHRMLFFDENKAHISNINKGGEQGAAIPDNAFFVAINITSVTGGIGDPTDPNNTYTGDLQLEYGEQSTPFERYGYKIKESALPANIGKRSAIVVLITDENNFTVRSRHDNGELVHHTWTRINKSPQHDIGWYAPSIIHNGNEIVQGSFNWIHMMALPNEDQHVGHGHGCETDKRAQFYVDGVEFVPSEEIGNTLEGELFSFNIASEIYAADSAETVANWNGANVVPQLPLILSTRHYMMGEIRGNSKMKNHNKLVVMRDNTTFARCYIAMQDARIEYFDRLQINNVENSMNALSVTAPTFSVIPPSTALFSGSAYDTSEGFRGELASSAIAYSDRFGYTFKTDLSRVNQDPKKMHVQTAGSGKIYFHPIITTQIATRAGVPADIFNRGDIIEGLVVRELIL